MDEPRIVQENFLQCWQRKDWKNMIKFTESNWLSYDWEGKKSLNPNCMKALFDWKELRRWKIEKIEKKSEKISYLVLIIYLFYNKIKVRRIKPTVSFQSDILTKLDREWKVNPFSCLEEYTLKGEKAWK